MNNIPIQAIPNQRFGVRLGGKRFEIVLKGIDDFVVVSISIAGVVIVEGWRAVSGSPLIPFKYLEDGNLIFITENEDYPNWRLFNSSQRLVYLTADEIASI